MSKDILKIIITGGPGSGKTTTISKLNEMNYRVLKESANTIINLFKIGPSKHRQKNIEKQQIYTENLIKSESGLFFLDQGLIDINVYNEINNHRKISEKIIERAKYFQYAFILKNLDPKIYPPDREEDFEQSKKIFELIKREYKKHKFKIIEVEADSVQNRTDFIINKINNLTKINK